MIFSILVWCDKNDLISMEQFFIDAIKPFFNISPTAGSISGMEISDETRAKLSKALKGKPSKKKGIKLSDEVRKRISEGHVGLRHSLETLEKISRASKGNKSNTGRAQSPEVRKKHSDALKGRPKTEEHIRKMVESRKANYVKENHYMYGRKQSPERIRKMQEGRARKRNAA